jgi:hypothetical protein
MTGIFWVIISYLLGSIPFGYVISRFSGKNILQLGWKKTSGSNVFKNVGKWQGVLTGLLDVGKGYLAVSGAQRLGLSFEIQVFSGTAAVIGHNWSLFLRFSGGRGIGTFIGAFLALSPIILLYSIIPLIALAIIWNASIGTILFLITAVFLSKKFGQFETAGFFTLISLVPIFIKRLSPISELKTSEKKFTLFFNRLIFDNNEALFNFRIKRIIEKEKNNPGRMTKIIKPLAASIIIPSKIGWRAAKFGVKMAKKPIDMLLKPSEKVVTEITVEDFKKMMLAASKKIVIHQEEINKINVFPVADKDTGYNLAATLLGVEGTISSKNYSDLRDLTEDIKDAAMINARGNAGMICTGYFIEVLDRIKHLDTINAFHLALAMQRGIKAARNSIAQPVEGTILDTIKAAGEKAFEMVKTQKEKNIIRVLDEAYKVSEVALKETKEKLKVLKENDVVDAGALGFLKILEAWIESLKGVPINSKIEVIEPIIQPETGKPLEYRYEIIFSFKKEAETNPEKIKQELSLTGDSLEIIESEDKIKIHIHTNEPDVIKNKFENLPEAEFRVEDMEAQMKKTEKKPLGLVVDQIADLPKEFLEKHNIEEVSFTTRFPNGENIISKEEIYPKMRGAIKSGKPLPITSAPSFREFLSAYQRALDKFEKILVITLSSKLSGAYSSARIARSIFKKPAKLNIFVFDCFTAEVAEGLIAFRAQNLISRGKTTEEIVEDLKQFSPKVSLLACIEDFRYVVRGGRFKLPKIFVKPVVFLQKMGIRVLIIVKDGEAKFLGIRFGKNIAKILAEEINKATVGGKIRAAIAHADNLKTAEELKNELEKEPGREISFIASVSPVVGTHTGPGALLVAFHLIDK